MLLLNVEQASVGRGLSRYLIETADALRKEVFWLSRRCFCESDMACNVVKMSTSTRGELTRKKSGFTHTKIREIYTIFSLRTDILLLNTTRHNATSKPLANRPELVS